MIQKISFFFLSFIVTAALFLGAASPVFAQTVTPPAASNIYQQEDDAWFLSVANALQMTVADLRTALSSGQTVAQLAQQHNVSLDSVVAAVTAARAAQLQVAVQAGKLTQDQADQLLTGLKTGYTFWFSTGKPPEDWKERDIAEDNLAILASQLSMTPHDLREALRSGETVTQLAREKGVSVASLVTDVTAIRAAQLQKAVAAGKLTQDQANHILSNLQRGFTFWFNNGNPPEDWKNRVIADGHIELIAAQLGMTPGQLLDNLKSGETIAQLAQEKGVNVDSLVTDVTAIRAAQLQKAVAAGKLTQEQANQMLTNLHKGYTTWFTSGKPPEGWQDRAVAEDHAAIIAKNLGMTPDQLKDELKSGTTLDQIAREKGVTLDSLAQAVTDKTSTRLDKEITSGKLTQDQADARLKLLQQQELDRLKNAQHPFIVRRAKSTPPASNSGG